MFRHKIFTRQPYQ